MDTYFTVSVIIPTLNSAKTLSLCLDSIAFQDYPKENLEVIFADGGSQDATLKVIDEFKNRNIGIKVKVIENKLRTGESGKAVALKASSCEIIAFIDSDNILDGKDWLKTMVKPFADKEIIAAEPISYTYRKTDGYITRYCSLMGMNDPLCYFLGNYDRECILSGRWTEMPYELLEEKSTYSKLKLAPEKMPTIGANGFLIRRNELEKLGIGDYLFDIDVLSQSLASDSTKSIAKVKLGIVHIFSGTLKGFYLKQIRRISDFKYFNANGLRRYEWGKVNRPGLVYFCLSCLFILPLFWQALMGYARRNDLVWFLHPVFCWITFFVYAAGVMFGQNAVLRRDKWQL